MEKDRFFMQQALQEAQKALECQEVPVGAVVVYANEIIARAYNQVESLQDAAAHAEMICLRLASQHLKNFRLIDCILYSTLEPCSMCAGAIILSRVKKVVWGAPDLRHGADGTVFDVLNKPHPIHRVEVTRGILQEESAQLLKSFFQETRACKKCSKS